MGRRRPRATQREEPEMRALSSALVERFMFARRHGMTFGGKRDTYEVLGYPQQITAAEYASRYERGGIAARVVDAKPSAVWRGDGNEAVFEDEDPETHTAFETAWQELNQQHDVWATLKRTHILASLTSFSVLLIGAAGIKGFETPLPKGKPGQLLYLQPYGGDVSEHGVTSRGMSATTFTADVVVQDYESDAGNPRFGQPKTYMLRRTDVTAPEFQRPVHWSRVIHVPSEGFLRDSVFGPPTLQAVWNYLLDLDKVVGGGSEAFWLRANAGLQLDIDPKMQLNPDPAAQKSELESLREQAEEYAHQMSRMMRTRGVKATQLGSDVADFKNQVDALVTLIAGTGGIPKRILVGNEAGSLASDQDRNNWNDQIAECRTSYAQPIILRQFVQRLLDFGYLPQPAQWDVNWPEALSQSEGEKLESAERASKLNAGGEIVITGAEIRERYLDLEPLPEEELEARTVDREDDEDEGYEDEGDETDDEMIDKLEAVLRKNGGKLTLAVNR